MDNYFILLELSFDPEETNVEKINTAINNKTQQWQNEAKNPRKAIMAKERIALVPEIKRIMLDPKLRSEEAQKAKNEKQKILKDVFYDILIKSAKGTISTEEINEIYEKYQQFNISLDEIKEKITVPIDADIKEKKEESSFEIINDDTISQLETYFNNLVIDDMSLYVFINGKKEDNVETLRSLSEKKLQFILQKGEKTTQDEMKQKIAGIAKNLFTSTESKQKYDNYLSGSRYYKLNQLIKDGASSNNNKLNATLYNVFISITKEEYSLSSESAIEYINNNCKINNIELDDNILSEILLSTQKTIETNQKIIENNKKASEVKPIEPPKEEPVDDFVDADKFDDVFVPQPTQVPKRKVNPTVKVDTKVNKPKQNVNTNTNAQSLKIQASTFELNQITNILQRRFAELTEETNKCMKEIDKFEGEYNKFNRIPSKGGLIFYLGVLFISLILNLIFLISFHSTMNQLIRFFILGSTAFILIDGIINARHLYSVTNFYKYKDLSITSKKQFDNILNSKFKNHIVPINELLNNFNGVKNYYENLRIEVENAYVMTYNMRVKCLNSLNKFTKFPKVSFYLPQRILGVIVVMFAVYFIVLKFFPNML